VKEMMLAILKLSKITWPLEQETAPSVTTQEETRQATGRRQ
jgi:hypothetical protein